MKRLGQWCKYGFLILLSVYILFGFLGLPYLLKTKVPPLVEQMTGRNFTLKGANFNPLDWNLKLYGIRLPESDGNDFVDIGYLQVDFNPWYLLRGEVGFEQVRLGRPSIRLQKDAQGLWNFQDILDHLAQNSAEEPPAEPENSENEGGWVPRFRIDQFGVESAQFLYADRSTAQPVALEIPNINFGIENLVTQSRAKGFSALTVDLGKHGLIEFDANLQTDTPALKGKLQISRLDLKPLMPYVASSIPLTLTVAPLSLTTTFDLSYRDTLALNVDFIDLALPSLGLKDPKFAATVTQTALHVDDIALQLKPDGNRTALAYSVRMAALQSRAVGLTDRTDDNTPIPLDFSDLSVSAGPLSENLAAPIPVKLALKLPKSGSLQSDASLAVDPLKAKAVLNLSHADLTAYAPYLRRHSYADLVSAWLDIRADIGFSQENGKNLLDTKADVTFSELQVDHGRSKERLFAFKTLDIRDIRAKGAPDSLSIDTVTLDEPYSRIHIAEDQSTNFDGLVKPQPTDDTPVTKAPAKEQANKERQQAFPVTIRRFQIVNASANFEDLSLPLPFAATIHELSGDLQGFTTKPGVASKLILKGAVNQYGSLAVKGDFTPTAFLDDSRIDLKFENVDLTDMSPYSGKFAGYKIKEGDIWLDLNYAIRRSKLQSTNTIVIKDLRLGEKVPSEDAINAPIGLAIALLKDSKGVMDIEIPVSGDVNDPKFDIGAVVLQAVTDVIINIVAAPFNFLGSMLGIKGEELKSLRFEPASAALMPPEREKLDNLAKALHERPALVLKFSGTWLQVQDEQAMKTRILQEKLLARQKALMEKNGEAPSMIEVMETMINEAALTDKLYAARDAFENDQSEVRNANYRKALDTILLDSIQLPEGALEDLARQRAGAIERYLLAASVPAKALGIADPESLKPCPSCETVPVQLELGINKEKI